MTSNKQTAIPIPAGALFTISTGVFSDYTVQGVFRAKSELNVDIIIEKYLAANPKQRESYEFDIKTFLASLTSLIEPLETYEFYLGDYMSIDDYYVEKHEATT